MEGTTPNMQTEVVKTTNSLELKKTTKGYTWNIKIYDDDIEVLKTKVKDLDDWCTTDYGGEL
jgi:hypothetical protein